MKSYKQISEDIRSVLVEDVTGTQLEILVNILSMYVYNIQANAVSQLLEGNLDTAISINSVIAKAAQFGVSVPRMTNPEVEFEVKCTGSSYTLYPGDEVISIGKFKFLYIGYYDDDKNFVENQCITSPAYEKLIRCVVTDKVTNIDVTQIPGEIYNEGISNVASKVFAYKDNQLMNIYDSFSDYLADANDNKLTSVTYPDYGLKIIDLNEGDQSEYHIILPNAMNQLTELLSVINTKAASKFVTVSAHRRGSANEANIKVVNLGSELLNHADTVQYVERNLKLTQLIKSNKDIEAFFSKYLFTLTGIRYNISFRISDDLILYVNDMYFDPINLDSLIPRFYIGLKSINVYPGVELQCKVSLRLNNQVDYDVSNQIEGYVKEYDGEFNTLIDEFDLIHKINSINNLIRIVKFETHYSAIIKFGDAYYTIQLDPDHYDEDVEDLDFDKVNEAPNPNKVYRLYTGKDKYLKTSVEWI